MPTNLSSKEKKSLHSLIKDKKIIISPADKGDTTVVMSTSQYLRLAYNHLNDNKTYQLLNKDPTKEVAQQYTLYLQTCKEEGLISADLHDKLTPPEDVHTQRMYFLPKVHKTPLKLRPIVSATNGPTEKASEYIDKQLQPYMTQVKSYFKNSEELIEILKTLKIPRHSLLVTLDIESLHTNITHEQAILSSLENSRTTPSKYFS